LRLRPHLAFERYQPGVHEGDPGAEVLDANDDMDEDNEIPLEMPGRIMSGTLGGDKRGVDRIYLAF